MELRRAQDAWSRSDVAVAAQEMSNGAAELGSAHIQAWDKDQPPWDPTCESVSDTVPTTAVVCQCHGRASLTPVGVTLPCPQTGGHGT